MTTHTVSVPELADELGVQGETLRAWLRREFPRPAGQHSKTWHLTPEQVDAARVWASAPQRRADDRDEHYVIDLCDEILGEHGLRQHPFDWLRADRDRRGNRGRLPVDAYYPKHELVIEYRERQHDQPVPFFDKPGVTTVSGVDRSTQRLLYDERRDQEIPAHGLTLSIIRPSDLDSTAAGRLRRNRDGDLVRLRALLSELRGRASSE
jgi:hypothetical protein